MGLQTPTPRLLVCAECVRRASTSFTGNGGSWASSFTQILQEQMDERAWQKRTLCTAAATTAAAPHKRVPCIVQAHEHQVGVERGRGGAHAHKTTTSQVFGFFDEKRRGRGGGEARNGVGGGSKTQMESDTSSGIRDAHFIFQRLPVSMTTAALTGRAYGAALPAGGNNV